MKSDISSSPSVFLRRGAGVWLLAILILMFVPWLGETLFNTKGEPREAIVAVAMLDSGDWILPVSFATDIPYKPPFLAWCIAVFSLFTGGVSEFTSRLPSAIAAISLAMMLFAFLRRNGAGLYVAVLSPLVMVTTIEVWRAASACRVDMVLTACMVGAILALYSFIGKRSTGAFWLSVLLMTCAVLTKGPVGMLLPCLCAGVYGLLRGNSFFRLLWMLGLAGLLSCVIPTLWYIAAYRQGGDTFYALVMEENFGRFMGSMSYASHENPIYYNFQTVLLGMLPYTILGLMALLVVSWKRFFGQLHPFREKAVRFWKRILALDPAVLYALTVTVVIFIFYCIPKSKRSVYLLPIYPFLAYFTVLLVLRLSTLRPVLVRVFCRIMGWIAVIVPLLFIAIRFAPLPEGLTARLGHNALLLEGLRGAHSGLLATVPLLFSVVAGVGCVVRRVHEDTRCSFTLSVLAVAMLLTSLSAAVLPPVLSAKSDRYIAEELEEMVPEGNIYMFIEDPLLRFYTANYYLGDRIVPLGCDETAEGILLVGEFDLPALHERFDSSYEFSLLKDWGRRSCDTRSPVLLFSFRKKQ